MKHPARLLLTLLSALLIVSLAPPAGADPTTGPPRSGPPLPIEITITSITPSVGVDTPAVVVRAVITNTGTSPITSLWARLQRDNRIGDRDGLAEVDSTQPNYTTRVGPGRGLDLDLAPGASSTIELTATPGELGITESGAYPILINLNGTLNGSAVRVGQAAFTLPYYPAAAMVDVAWLWPLIDRPHRASADLFLDDDLARSIAPGGRLDRLLAAVETYGVPAAMTVMIDPGLVDDLVAMSDGYQYLNADGVATTGEAAQSASDFIERLRAVASQVTMTITSYADIDTVATVRAGLGRLVSEARTEGAAIVDEVLQTTTMTTLDWPIGGITTEAAVAASEQAGVSTFVLTGVAFGQPDYLHSDDEITESALTRLPGAAAASRAIVADPALQRILGEGASYAAGPYAGRQRLTAELAMIAQEAPTRPRTVLLAPPRRWDPSSDYVAALLSLTTTTSWVAPVGLGSVLSGPAEDRGPLDYPANLSVDELPGAAIDTLKGPLSQIDTLRSAFSSTDAAVVLGDDQRAVYRALSTANRTQSGVVAERAAAIAAALGALRDQIRIVPPSNGTYTLASSDAPLVFTIENTLPVAVSYRLGLDPRASTGLSVEDIGIQEIGPASRATVRLPTSVERSGSFSVVAQIRTPDGQPLGNDVTIKVSSSAYGTVALLVTTASSLLLLAMIGRRFVRRQRARAAERLAEAEQPVPDGADEYTEDEWLDPAVAASLDSHGIPPADSAAPPGGTDAPAPPTDTTEPPVNRR